MPAPHWMHVVPALVAHCATNPAAVQGNHGGSLLVNLTIMTPVADVQLLLDDTGEQPLSLASWDLDSHDVAPLDDWQLYIYT